MTGGNVKGNIKCDIDIPMPCAIVIFGASGDLVRKKLIPSLYRLHKNGFLPERFLILGTGRTKMGDDQFRDEMFQHAKSSIPGLDGGTWTDFADAIYYCSVEYSDPATYRSCLAERLAVLEKERGTEGNRVFYMATPPTIFEPVINNLANGGLLEGSGFRRVVIEKPFGRDLESARVLNSSLQKYFKEEQIFRIDHYMAKETVQNILMFRFANSIFEPLWNRRYIDSIQITAAESVGIEKRAGYYDQSGVLRDMFQNHIFQLLSLIAMEPPAAFEESRVREEKLKVFRSIRPIPLDEKMGEHLVLGQYGEGNIGGEKARSYREEEGVRSGSSTATYAAMRIFIDNWRWNGVPFYLRSGKRLPSKNTEIVIRYKQVPHMMFSRIMDDKIDPNTLVFRVQPDEGINLNFQTKKPMSKICLNPVSMDYSYSKEVFLDAYEWALLDCMLGDQLLFWRQEGIDATWELLTPVLNKIESGDGKTPVHIYPSGSQGPKEADRLLRIDGNSWRPL